MYIIAGPGSPGSCCEKPRRSTCLIRLICFAQEVFQCT